MENPKLLKYFLVFLLAGTILFSCEKETQSTVSSPENSLVSDTIGYSVSIKEIRTIAENFPKGRLINGYLKNAISKTGKNSEAAKQWGGFAVKEIENVTAVNDDNAEPLFYTINYKEGGFLILAADKRSIPILTYSSTGTFSSDTDDYPEGVKYWVHFAKEQIRTIRKNHLDSDPEIEAKWKLAGDIPTSSTTMKEPPIGPCEDEYHIIGPLIGTNWDQYCGYNTYMPTLTCNPYNPYICGHAYAGCVPVALAQTMRFFEHPASYNWSTMPNTSGSTATATLIADIWDDIPNGSKSYTCSGTGVVHNYNIANLLKYNYSYSYAAQGSYDREQVKQNIYNHKPVILSAIDGSTGHTWVCEGMNNSKICIDDYIAVSFLSFYMNWGWGGDYNGLYTYDNFNPASNSFDSDVIMVYNIKP